MHVVIYQVLIDPPPPDPTINRVTNSINKMSDLQYFAINEHKICRIHKIVFQGNKKVRKVKSLTKENN